MARIINRTETATQASGTTYQVTLGAHQSGDLLLVCLTQDGGAATAIAPDASAVTAGWAMIGTQAAFADSKQAWAYLYADSSSETNPTFTGANDDWIGTCLVVREADSGGSILWQRSNWGGTGAGIATGTSNAIAASSAGGTTVITAPEDALLLYSWSSDGGAYLRCKSDELIADSKVNNTGASHIIGHRQHGASGNPADVTVYSTELIEGGNGWVLAIPNATGGNLEKDCRSGITEVEWFGNFMAARGALVTISNGTPAVVTYTAPTTDQFLDGQCVWFSSTGSLPTGITSNRNYYITGLNTGTNTFNLSETLGGATVNTSSAGSGTHTATPGWGAANDIVASINSISTLSTMPGAGVSATFSAPATPWGRMSTLSNAVSTAGAWAGGTRKIPSTDMSDGIVAVQWMVDMSPTTARAGAEGAILLFSDGTNWAAFQLAPRALYAQSTVQQAFIDLDNGTPYASSGTLDTTSITYVVPLYHRIGSSTSADAILIKNLFVMRTAILTGGGEDFPLDFVTLSDAMNSWGSIDLASKQGSSQILGKAKVQIGDGTNKMYWDTSGASFEFPVPFATTDNVSKNWNGNADSVSLIIKAASGNTVNLSSGSITTSVPQSVNIDATSATTGISFAGQSFKGLSNFTDAAGVVLTTPTFKECGTVSLKANMTGMSVSKTVGAVPAVAVTANSKTITTSTIDVTGTSATYHLSLSSSVTAITLNTVTLSGTPATDKIYSELASGTLTITTNGLGTTLVAGDVTFIGGSTATAVIASPQVYQKVTVTGITTGARVQIYDTTSSTELFNGTATAGNTVVTGGTVVWTDPVAASANRAIRIRVSYVSGVTAKNFIETSGLTCGQTSGTAEITYPVSPTDDTVYNANGENGSTIYGGGEITFVDASPDRVEMNMTASTLSLQKQYAAWVYYAFTATGIATDIDYINAIDTANYEFTSIRWKNTATAPATLTITGGYAWDSSTGLAITLVDTTGGTIFLMPDHVVAYATGSGVTAQDVADIAAEVLTQASTTPIHADIRKVNSYTVDGVGSDADPWGPA